MSSPPQRRTISTQEVVRRRFSAAGPEAETSDWVAAEEPLEIRVDGQPAAVTMRTPGHDRELAAGFLYTEGVIDGADDLTALAHVDDPADPRGNTVDAVLAAGVPAGRRRKADRQLYASSSCGICGKATIDKVLQGCPPLQDIPALPGPEVILSLVAPMAKDQDTFSVTGGLHAAALFSLDGSLEVSREDIGRHNAVDKVIGWRLLQDQVPVDNRILLISGRAGFEIVQKALVARIPIVAAVGAPSSLAVDLAAESGMALIGFLRDGRYNLYGAHPRSE